jgi:hypothetical protein
MNFHADRPRAIARGRLTATKANLLLNVESRS